MFDGVRISNERLISASGLSIVGLLLDKTNLARRLNQSRLKENAAPHIRNSDVAFSYIGMLCQGKSQFDFVREMDSDPEYYRLALGIRQHPSSETLRQRLDMAGNQWHHDIQDENIVLLKESHAIFTPCHSTYVPFDVDVSPFDNSGTHKEGVSRTYKGFAGYAPIFAYLGVEGYLIHTELRHGSDHSQKNTVPFLKEAIARAKRLTDRPLLLRMDAGNDSIENILLCHEPETRCDYLIKRNLRRESVDAWHAVAQRHAARVTNPRPGKTVYIGSDQASVEGLEQPVRIVFQVTVRTSSAQGQLFLVPDIEVQTWWTSLDLPEDTVIELYHGHGTSEQFHSELKSDMDLERLPSGKFATNDLVLQLAMLAYNILRRMGQETILEDDSPLRKPAQRRRIRTIIQNLMLIATRMVAHAHKVYLNLGRSNGWIRTFQRLYESFAA